MAELRVLETGELQEAAQLADLVFRDQEQKSMGIAFPYIFAAEAPESLGVYDQGKLVAFMGIVPARITVGPAALQVYSIGSVCTHEDARGKGYASKLLDQAMSHMREAGASLMLVSGDRSLYLRAGCRTFGQMRQYVLTPPTDALHILHHEINAEAAYRSRPAEAKDFSAMAGLYAQELTHYDLSLYDLSRLIQAEPLASCYKLSHRTWIAERENGEAAAFAVIGVPYGEHVTAAPLVIEAAGEPAAIAALCLKAMTEHGLKSLKFPVGLHRLELIQELDRSGFASEARANEGTIKILDPAKLWQQLLPYLTDKNPGAARISVTASADETSAALLLDGQTAAELSTDQLSAMIFQKMDAEDGFKLPDELQKRLEGAFPIPFPFTGGLYYI
ncbi:hypothetical protein AWM70_16955 [Paenibacillus yonginensis]|uniref:N-acetyltransferase domain-containing protein n=1 Tax=Paenibacillus yonginensis TaxID=1462996 RepID=A0A1B1N3S7_9BACL|nr:GNAT family N-acetyltransferase [Paenibacillus yonginensis]ANS76062.1 hypothetical protein AWM70_16955 [Paenibacillus yonginensis]